MAQDDGQERTEEATPKRKRDARDKGQVPRSRELTTLLMLVICSGALYVMGGHIVEMLNKTMEVNFTLSREQIFDTHTLLKLFDETMVAGLWGLAPFLLVTVIVALLAPALLGGWSFSSDAVGFKWEKMDPIKGLKRIFGWQGVMELFKAVAKFLIVVVATATVLWLFFDQYLGLGNESLQRGLIHAAELVFWALLVASCALGLVAAVDAPFQLWTHNKQLKMTHQEIKDEYKSTEGKPEVKRRIREVQMAMSQRRMMADVPKADVIITNPTHYAVALRYDPKSMAAPVMVAKGADLMAAEIRRVATESTVPIMSSPALARSIFYHTDIGAEVPTGLYKAVAMILAFVFQTRRKRQNYSAQPLSMPDVPIPDELRRD